MPDEEMGCGCGCQDCECKEIDVSKGKTETMIELREQLQIFKDYICTISMTPCSQLGKIMAKVIFWMWCFFKNLLNYVETLDNQEQDMSGYVTIQQYNQLSNQLSSQLNNQLKNLCAALECHDEILTELIKQTKVDFSENVNFGMRSTDSNGEDGLSGTYTTIETSDDGSFVVKWNMIDNGELGQGRIEGKVNHTYSIEEDGYIKAEIKSITLNKASYQLSGGSTNIQPNATISVVRNGTTIWKKDYHPTNSWSETINKTFDVNDVKLLAPNGGSSGDIFVFETFDDWTSGDTRGEVYVSYLNNNEKLSQELVPCDFNCSDYESEGDA